MESSRARGFGIVVLTYLAALALAIAVAAIMGRDAPILTVFVADCAATLLVFAASVAFANASLYDPYWSVAPPLIALEGIAAEQLRAFNRTKRSGEICTRGLWGWSRHPNYLGEMGFWWGLWLFAVAAAPAWYWSAIGPLAITVMFVAASIPMLERRSHERRPGYADHVKRVPVLLPRRPRA